jgi:STE24 endopeptidase
LWHKATFAVIPSQNLMHPFSIVFLVALTLTTTFRAWLAWRQIRFVSGHRDRVPPPFRKKISLEAHQRAGDYTIEKTRLGIWELFVDTLLALIFTLGGGFNWIDQTLRGMGVGWVGLGVGLVVAVVAISGLVGLPFAIYRTFVIEGRFGFNRMTPGLFVTDLIKQTALSATIGLPVLVVILWIMGALGANWWIYAWLFYMVFSILMMVILPTWIAPLFNKFSPLSNDELKVRIENLLSRCGFKSQGLFVMDGSKRSSHGNAYFTGFGKSKRIVFFDTLIDRLQPTEIEAVLAHELGHFKRRHITKRIALMFVLSFALLALLGWLIKEPWFFEGLGVTEASNGMALILFFTALPAFTFFLQPISSLYSRKHEFEADEYAAVQTRSADLITALVKLYQDNAATLTPDPLYSAVYDSHPPAAIRIAHLRELTGASV